MGLHDEWAALNADPFKQAKKVKRGAYRTKAGQQQIREFEPMSHFSAARAKAQEAAGSFWTVQERNELYYKHVPLLITAIRFEPNGGMKGKDGQSKDRWVLKLERQDTQESKQMGFEDNLFRQTLFTELQAHLDEAGAIGPVILDQVGTGKGNPAWDLVEVE